MSKLSIFGIFILFTTFSSLSFSEENSDAASFAALQMKLLMSEQVSDEPAPEEKIDDFAELERTESQDCDEQEGKVKSLLTFLPDAKSLASAEAKHAAKELVTLSKNTRFDSDCAAWQIEIAQQFTKVRYKHKGYKKNLYQILSENQGGEVNVLAVEVLRYSLVFGEVQNTEWKSLETSFQHITHQDLRNVIDTLFQTTVTKGQTSDELLKQIQSLLLLSQQKALGMPLKIKESYLIGLVLAKSQADLPSLFPQLYTQYHGQVEKPVRIGKYVRSYIQSQPSTESYQLLSVFLGDVSSPDVKLNRRDAKKLLSMLNRLRPVAIKAEENIEITQAWKVILEQHEKIITDIVDSSSAKVEEKQYWLEFYQQKPNKVS